jgi:hypothetical protein
VTSTPGASHRHDEKTVGRPTYRLTKSVLRIPRATARRAIVYSAFAAFLLATAATVSASDPGHGRQCNCNPNIADAQVVQWDIPSQLDTSSGAITVDVHSSHSGRLWFLTRALEVKLYRFEPGKPIRTKAANWKSFELNPLSFTTGGLRRIKVHRNDRDVFVRTHTSLQRINTNCTTGLLSETCERVTWFDQLTPPVEGGIFDPFFHVSDVSIDDCNVYTTSAVADATGTVVDPDGSFLQQLSPCRSVPNAADSTRGTTQVKRWTVGGGAGFCLAAGDSAPCISGVFVHPDKNHLVYFSQPADSKIGELDVRYNKVRRWDLTRLGAGVFEPRQLEVDDDGIVWAVTGSGHVVRLDPYKNRLSKHMMPSGQDADPFGIAVDHGVVGYTNSSAAVNKVAMVFPRINSIYVAPVTVTVPPKYIDVEFVVERANTTKGTAAPMKGMVHAQITDKNDGFFVEGVVSDAGSMVPLGITPDMSKKIGTYFYAVGTPDNLVANRIGQIVLPSKNRKHGHARDDDDHDRDGKRDDVDDDDDDDGIKDGDDPDDDDDCVDDHNDWDDDNDGIDDKDDRKDRKEDRYTREQESVAGGQSVDYPTTIGTNNLLLVATATAADPTALLGLEVYNPAGQLVARALPTPGTAVATVPTLTAGSYVVRVKNLGLMPTALATGFLTETGWPVELPSLP